MKEYILFAVAVLFLVSCIDSFIMKYKYKKLQEERNELNQKLLKSDNKLSMISYHFRHYEEGVNGFTILRDIGNVLKYEDKDETEMRE